jgi:class 3 adenylate cyclase
VTEPDEVMSRATAAALGVVLALPLIGLGVLLAAPSTDAEWEHHPSHFWLVLGTAAVSAALGWAVGNAALRRRDARLFLVSLAFVSAAAFLGLHALATPKVLLEGSNAGFVVATPVGLLLASALAAVSSLRLDGAPARWLMSHTTPIRFALVTLVVAWAVWSLSSLPPLDQAEPPEAGSAFMVSLAVPAIGLFAVAAWSYVRLAFARRSVLLVAVAAAWVLLAEAMLAVTVARNWHASWWEWHGLMLTAFGVIAVAARQLPETERFSELYLDEVAQGSREASVLFADLEGFTSFSEQQEPDAVHTMLNTYFEAVVPAVRREGARLDKFIGDAVMVTFNVTADQPDHAERAARAALAFQASSARVAAQHPTWPRFRVGVNTGPVSMGVVGGGDQRGYTVLGDTVNVASRIEGLAPVGGVAIGGATLRALSGALVSPLGALEVKGRRETVETWRLDGLEDSAPTPDR